MYHIVKVEYLQDYKLKVWFDDGKAVIADFEEFIKNHNNPMTTQFLDKSRFANVEITNTGHLTWEDGQMDISAHSIYEGRFSHSEDD